MSWKSPLLFGGLTFLALLSACQEVPLTGPGSEESTAAPTGARVQRAAPQTLDDFFVDVALQAPGFGGAFLDSSGVLVFHLTDMSQEAAARSALARLLDPPRVSAGGRLTTGEMRAVRGQYDFIQLRNWLASARSRILNVPGVVYVDVDETRNRIAVGVQTGQAATIVESAFTSLGVPREAVIVRLSPPVERVATL